MNYEQTFGGWLIELKRHEGLVPLSQEHHSHLLFASRLLKGRPEGIRSNWPAKNQQEELIKAVKEYYLSDILSHFKLEEELVFPLYKQFMDDPEATALLEHILAEHQEVREMVQSLDQLAGGELEERLTKLGEHIKGHIQKEERRLFELIQEQVPTDELVELGVLLRQHSNLKCSHLL